VTCGIISSAENIPAATATASGTAALDQDAIAEVEPSNLRSSVPAANDDNDDDDDDDDDRGEHHKKNYRDHLTSILLCV